MRLIDGDALIEFSTLCMTQDDEWAVKVSTIESAPTVFTPDPVKHGKWVSGYPITCSVCGKPAFQVSDTWEKYVAQITDYCPHCGAKMDLEDKYEAD